MRFSIHAALCTKVIQVSLLLFQKSIKIQRYSDNENEIEDKTLSGTLKDTLNRCSSRFIVHDLSKVFHVKLFERVFWRFFSVAILCFIMYTASLYVERYLPKDKRTEIIYRELQQTDLTEIRFCLRGTFSLLSCAIIAHYFFIVTPETKEKCALLWILRMVICRSDSRLLVRIVM